MATIRKYRFDTDFDSEEPATDEAIMDEPVEEFVEIEIEEVAPPKPTFTEEQLAEARSESYSQGHATGLTEARAEVEERAAQALDGIRAQLETLGQTRGEIEELRERSAVAIAVAIARKALPEIARNEAISGIEELIRECLPRLHEEPRVVIRVSDALLDTARNRIGPISANCGFRGEVILLGDETLADTDCRVEWADGGSEYDTGRIWQEIDAITQGFVDTMLPRSQEHDAASDTGEGNVQPTPEDTPVQDIQP